MQKGIKGSGGREEGLKVHQEEKREDETEDFECQDKESSRRSGKSSRHDTIKHNNRPGYSATQLRRQESTERKGCFIQVFQNFAKWKREKQHSRKRGQREPRHKDSNDD